MKKLILSIHGTWLPPNPMLVGYTKDYSYGIVYMQMLTRMRALMRYIQLYEIAQNWLINTLRNYIDKTNVPYYRLDILKLSNLQISRNNIYNQIYILFILPNFQKKNHRGTYLNQCWLFTNRTAGYTLNHIENLDFIHKKSLENIVHISFCARPVPYQERFPRHRLKRKLLVRYPSMHHGTYVTAIWQEAH